MSTATSWEVPGGFTNTGLCVNGDGNFAIGDFTNERIHLANKWGDSLGYIALESAPDGSVQGVAWDTLRGHYWVSHYSSNFTGTIKRYDQSGNLQASYPSTPSQIGPNGCVYEASSDRLLVVHSVNRLFSYSCSTGALVEDIPFSGSLGGQTDGLTLDPDPTYIWVSVDSAAPGKVVKINRTTGAIVSEFSLVGAGSPENIAFLDGILHICCDRGFHEGVPNGNRVYRFTPQGVPSLVPPRPAAPFLEPIAQPRSVVQTAWAPFAPMDVPGTPVTTGWPSVWGM